jgi:hypothetical protein
MGGMAWMLLNWVMFGTYYGCSGPFCSLWGTTFSVLGEVLGIGTGCSWIPELQIAPSLPFMAMAAILDFSRPVAIVVFSVYHFILGALMSWLFISLCGWVLKRQREGHKI